MLAIILRFAFTDPSFTTKMKYIGDRIKPVFVRFFGTQTVKRNSS
jgi:hypothetical protein